MCEQDEALVLVRADTDVALEEVRRFCEKTVGAERVRTNHDATNFLLVRLPDVEVADMCKRLQSLGHPIMIFLTFGDWPQLAIEVEQPVDVTPLPGPSSTQTTGALGSVVAALTTTLGSSPSPIAQANGGDRTDGLPLWERLTMREIQVLRMIAKGMTDRQIADGLGLSVNTIRDYSQSVLRKMQSHNRIQALEAARQFGVL